MIDRFLWNLRSGFFTRLAAGSILSIASVAASAEYSGAEFFPIEPGSYWIYGDGDGDWTTRVEPSTVDVNGIATRQLTDSDGWTSWMTNDELGLRMHRNFEPDGDVPGHAEAFPVTTTFVPPLRYLDPVFHSGQHYELSGEVTVDIEGQGTFTGSYASDIAIGGMEQITVPAGTYEAVVISVEESIRVGMDGNTLVDDDICTLWLVRGIGMVKDACRDDSESVLTETNLSPIIDAGRLAVLPNSGYQVLVETDGGTASPASSTYSVRNPGSQTLEFSVSSDADWLDIAPAQGQLDPGTEIDIILSVNGNAQALASNQFYVAPVRFDNLTDGAGNTVRAASVFLFSGQGTGWSVSTDEGFDDTTSLAAENLPANTTAELKMLIGAPATQQAGVAAASIPDINLAFQLRTTIGPEDRFTVSVAGAPVRQWSGTQDWHPACVPLSACNQFPCEINFSFQRRSVTSNAENAVYIDNVGIAPDVQPYASVLPGSRSAQVGRPVTAFATLINAGTAVGEDCALRPATPVPGTFLYQTTDPLTNGLVGDANVPHNVPGGIAQSFMFAFTPDATLAPTDVELRFDCSNSCGSAAVVRGLNTFLLSAADHPVPDVVALAATLGADGIVKIPTEGSTGVFAVASANVGAGGAIRVSADTGEASIPVNLLVCQADAETSVCLSDPASHVDLEIATDATDVFGIFVQESGEVPFDPAAHRVFVRFRDQAGVVRGATSVAVCSQRQCP